MATILTLSIFGLSYLFIMTEKINRAIVAGAGGILMVILGIYDLNAAFTDYIDWNTVALLFAMMILVSITSQTGVFQYIAIKLAQKVNGRAIPLLFVISILTATGSAFLDNVTTVLLFAPILLTLTRLLDVPAVPYLTVMILSSNIGGTATLIGDPPNIMIGQAVEHLSFNDFLFNLAPVAIIIFVIVLITLAVFYRKQLVITEKNRQELMNINPATYLKKDGMLVKSLSVLALTITGFILHPVIHVELTSVAIAGAILLLLLTQGEHDVNEAFKSVEWETLFFFMGLFMLVGGLEKVGIIDEIARNILYYTEGDLPRTALLILWISGILSGFVDNIPFVAAMIPVIFEFQEYGMTNIDPLWWSLALGACLGGNATLIGASANVVVAGLAAGSKQPIRFLDFFKVGIFVVIISLIISTVYLYYRYLIDFL